jgi:hypothetical protein
MLLSDLDGAVMTEQVGKAFPVEKEQQKERRMKPSLLRPSCFTL